VSDAEAADTIEVDGESVTVRSLCTLVNHAGNFLARHGIAGDYGFAAPDDGRFDAPAERFGFSGTAPVFRAETLAKVGGLADPFFAYNEDTDWCLRARLAGLRIIYHPGATVTHRLSATSGGAASAFVRFLAQRNALLCLTRNAPADVAGRFVWRRIREGPGPGSDGPW
jgi:GT2 family glycosyltransferase